MSLVKLKCAFCNKYFFREKGRFNEAKKFGWKQYCSWKCLSENRIKNKLLICENCGKTFKRTLSGISPHNYCSQSCAAIANNRKRLKSSPKIKPKLKTCIWCGKQFRKSSGNKKYCSMKCRNEAEPRHDKQKLINIIRRKVEELQRIPTRREMKESNSCQDIFGSWNNAIIAAGFKPNRSHSQRMYKRIATKALDGHSCDSISEVLIDNWLAENKIVHVKNIPYPETNHKADWGINFKGKTIFVEYFGLAKDSPRYDRAVEKKKVLCQKHKLSLIAIYPQDLYPKKFLKENLENKFKNFLIG